MEKWLLQFNPDKCKQMTISRRPTFISERRELIDPIQSLPIEIAPTSSERDLGVVIDDKITFKGHIGGIIKKVNKLMGLIRRTFIYLDKEVFVPLYTSLVRSHLEYAQSVWSPHSKGGIRRLEQVQRNATRLVN